MNRSQSATRMPQFLAAALAATVLLAAQAQAQRVSLDSLAGDHVDILDTQNRGASPVAACTTIDQPGSYAVVRNLSAVGDCLLVAADNVTIDLGGHVLTGDGTGDGVTTDGTSALPRANIAVRNGTVTGFIRGLDLEFARGSVVRQVRAIENTGDGIFVGTAGTVTGATARRNGGNGISSGLFSAVAGNLAQGNADFGIYSGTSMVTGNTVSGNGGMGLYAGLGSTVNGNAAQANGDEGLWVNCPSNVFDNTAVSNGQTNLVLVANGCTDVNNLAP